MQRFTLGPLRSDEDRRIALMEIERKLNEFAELESAEGAVATWDLILGKPSTFPPSSHTHDTRYYTEDEVDALLGEIELTPGPVGPQGLQGAPGLAEDVVLPFYLADGTPSFIPMDTA